jgi:DNA-binding transcriptional MerR regulator
VEVASAVEDGGPALRPVDLARLAGISAQQVRNYAESGILPPAERTDSGYRVFGEPHRHALVAYRAIAKGYGPVTARQIMQALHDDDEPVALALVDAAHAALHAERRSLAAVAQALAAVAGEAGDGGGRDRGVAASTGNLRVGELAAELGVRPSALRVWESAGLLAPGRERGTAYRTYGAGDVRDARMIQMLRRSGYLFAQIRPVLDDLRRRGSTDAMRSALAQRRDGLTARTAAMLAGAGELHRYLEYLTLRTQC